MRFHRIVSGAAALVMVVSIASCSPKTARTTGSADRASPPPFPVNFDPAIFGKDSADITNEWWPLKPGTQWLWEGQALDGEEAIRRRVIFTVTDLVKEIAGVRTLVGWDRDYNDELLVEQELIFLAQDKEGNIWHLGQSSELYDEGELDGTMTWLVGYLEGAKAGILMPADPRPGTPEYSEGYAPPPYYWDDVAKVAQAGQRVCVRSRCYEGAIVIEEYEPTIEDAFQLKYWVRGVGNIKTGWRGEGEEEQEVLDLIRMRNVSPADLLTARAEALKLEARSSVYGYTSPLQPRESAQPGAPPTP